MTNSVSVCIPTYQSESFIDRTLLCARNQTYKNLKIIVSVDLSSDNTVEICQRHAQQDQRIHIIVQKERLGWSQNANATLEAVDTDYFFLYFHDDIIKPDYVDILLLSLINNSQAASAHCDLVEFGLINTIKPAYTYDGEAINRLIQFLTHQKGTTLRSLIRRTDTFKNFRFPKIPGDGSWVAYIFHLKLLALGPAIGLHNSLYYRWQRENSLTRSKGWLPSNLDDLLEGSLVAFRIGQDIIDESATSTSEQIVGHYCLQLFLEKYLKNHQLRLKNNPLIDLANKIPTVDKRLLSQSLTQVDNEITAYVTQIEAQ